MSITVDATYENGVLRPDQPLALAENSRVRISVTTEQPRPSSDLGTLRALRAEVLKDGGVPLDWGGIEDEVAARRGGWREGQ
jgi:predicted DNA-binding antitoxin AbrB/MazE fold protein